MYQCMHHTARAYLLRLPVYRVHPPAHPDIRERTVCDRRIAQNDDVVCQIDNLDRAFDDERLRDRLLQELLPAALLEARVVKVFRRPAEFVVRRDREGDGAQGAEVEERDVSLQHACIAQVHVDRGFEADVDPEC